MRATIRLIGKAIKNGTTHLPLRNHAVKLATLARPKDYLGQVKQIFDEATRRWRYVNDPFGAELVSYHPEALTNMVMGIDGRGMGNGFGAGDCDCITAALGAMLQSIGRPVRIAVTAPPHSPPGTNFTHVFAQANVPNIGWVTVDPVAWPKHGFGHTPRHSRIAFFDLNGRLLSARGNVRGL